MLYRPESAERYEPPVHKLVFEAEQSMSGSALLTTVRERTGLDASSFDRLLWHGGLHVARRRVLDPLQLGQVEAGSRVAAYWFSREPEPLPLPDNAICFDDDGVVAVNKPAWLPVQGTRASVRFSLEHLLRERTECPSLQAIHRLDRATSGVNLFARDSETAARLCGQFAKRTVHKEYLAVVWPRPGKSCWEVTGHMVRADHPRHAFYTFSREAVPGGRPSHTSFRLLGDRGDRALVAAVPQTGRTHQIRVHLLCSGTPIVGDALYGPAWAPGTPWSAERLQLHAASIRVELRSGRNLGPVEIRAPTHSDWLG